MRSTTILSLASALMLAAGGLSWWGGLGAWAYCYEAVGALLALIVFLDVLSR
jgi:hypothetical protein